jgi:hypothetical protein
MKTKDIIAEEIKTHVLTLLTCEKTLDLGGFGIQHLTVEKMHTLFDAELLYIIHTLIPAEKMKEESHIFKVKYPRGWKEAFKEEHFPAWLKRRYPVRYIERTEKVRFTAFNLYPKFPAFYPDKCRDSIQHIVTEYERYGDVEE